MTSLKLTEIAVLTGARLEGDGSLEVVGPASLEEAGEDEVSFLARDQRASRLERTRAAAVIIEEGVSCERSDLALLRCADPQQAFNRLVSAFALPRPVRSPGIHPSAVVAEGAQVHSEAHIGPLCVIEADARVAAGVVLHGHVTLGAGSTVGPRSQLYPGVVLYPHVSVGADCILHAGAVLGSDGFGFEPSREGWVKTPQGGTVVVEDEVEIGANVTIDNARFKATRIERGVKIDNLVHVAHNCRIEASAMLVAQVGVAGSTRIGAGAILAGQAGVSGHLHVGAGAQVGGASAVFEDVPAGEQWWGVPAQPKLEAIRVTKLKGRVGRLVEKLRELQRRVDQLEAGR
jgi:UDP-3-O-[3-hydroxymyristoyl] glucosamine N-acyltransferase